jgi:hypothetical protein
MTTTDPQSLSSVLEDVLNGWQATTGQRPPALMFCAAEHPLDPATLCRRFDGHGGVHAADEHDAWTDTDSYLEGTP